MSDEAADGTVDRDGAAETPAHRLDVRGLACPLPVLKTRKAIRDIPVGGLIEVLVTDPASPLDFEVYCHRAGHELVSQDERDGVFTFRVRRGA